MTQKLTPECPQRHWIHNASGEKMLRTNGLKCPKLEIHFTSHDRSQTKKSIQKLETWNSGDGDGDRGKKIRTQGLDSGLLAQAKNEQMLRWI